MKLQGGFSDYVMALAIACAFPIVRYIMDRRVYGVRGRHCQIGVLAFTMHSALWLVRSLLIRVI